MGVPISDVSRRLGHSDVATTLKIYTHSNMEQDKLIAQKLEERYGNLFVTNKLNFQVIASIVVGEQYASEEEIINAVSFITGKNVNENNKEMLFLSCKQYFLKKYSYLQEITLFLNDNIKDEVKSSFINLINNLNQNLSYIRPMNSF